MDARMCRTFLLITVLIAVHGYQSQNHWSTTTKSYESGLWDRGSKAGTHTNTTQGFHCPPECTYCMMYRRKGNRICRAFDMTGSINQTFVNVLSEIQRQAKDEILALPHFRTNVMLATCEGFKYYLKKWSELGSDVKTIINSFLNHPNGTDAAAMSQIPKKLFTMIDSNFTAEIYPTLSVDVKKVICRNLRKEDCLIRKFILDNFQCQSVLLSGGEAPTEDDIDSVLNFKDYAHWNRDTWAVAFNYTTRKLSMRHFEEAPIDVVIDSMGELSKSCGNFSSRSIGVITKRIIANFKSMSNIPTDQDHTLMNLLQQCGADPRSFRTLYDDSKILSMMDVSKASPGSAMKFIEEIPSFNPSTLTRDQIPRLVNAMSRKQLEQLNATEMEHALCNFCQTSFDSLKKGKKRMVTNIIRKKLPAYTNPENFNETKVECMKCMIPYFPSSVFKHIPTHVIGEMLSENVSQQMDITSREQARTMMSLTRQLFNKTDGKFTRENLRQMGPRVCLKALNATDYDAIPDSSFDEEFLNSLDETLREEEEENNVGRRARAAMNKLKRKFQKQLGTKKLLQSKFASLISPADIENMTSSDILEIGNSGNPLEVSPKQSRNLMKRIKQERASNGFDLETIKNLGPLSCGFTVSDIENFPHDSSFVEILNVIGNNECTEQMRDLYKLRKEYMGFDSITAETLTSETTAAAISDISPPILLMHSDEELNKYGTQLCADIIETVQAVDTTKLLTKKELEDKWKYFTSCQGKQTAGTFSGDELNLAGNLLCGINEKDIRRINSSSIEATIKTLDQCPTLGKKERDAALSVYTSYKEITSGAQVKPTTLIDVGTLAAALPKHILDTISYETMAESVPFAMEAIKKRKSLEHIRKNAGFKNDIREDDQTNFDAQEKYFKEKSAIAMENTIDVATSRKRRSTASLTCAAMQLLGTTGLSALSTTQISNLADDEFIECAETLGSVTDYGSDQKEALLGVATRSTVWGDPSTWLTTDIYNSGVICQAMTEAQIASLDLDLDTVSRLGQFDGWDTLKKKAVFDRWLSQHKAGDSSTITSSELRSLGHITCGAEISYINNIQLSVYQGAVDSIGELTSCDSSQLQAFANLAKTAYGNDVSTWDSTVITNVGTSIGGLSASEIGSLTALQVDAVDPNHISYIPDAIFSGFTVSQIKTFSPSQAQSTTTSQRAALTSGQLDALSTVASISWGSAGSGVDNVMTSSSVVILSVLLTIFYIQ